MYLSRNRKEGMSISRGGHYFYTVAFRGGWVKRGAFELNLREEIMESDRFQEVKAQLI